MLQTLELIQNISMLQLATLAPDIVTLRLILFTLLNRV